ncbi:hypothetical protein glysoja_008784 [Glycine soja]|nr:hypothetical protein glysoja_008784 [Glycine soja]
MEQKLLDEIDRLKEELQHCDENMNSIVPSLAKVERRNIVSCKSILFTTFHSQENISYEFKLLRYRSLWGKENELTAEIDKLRAEVEKAEKSLDHAIPGDVRRGLNSVTKISRE